MGVDIRAVQEMIGIPSFKEPHFLAKALTHPSYSNEDQSLTPEQRRCQRQEYKRLAFLGDAIYGAVVTEFLYLQFPEEDPGVLSKSWKSELIERQQHAKFAERLGLRTLCVLGKGEVVKTEAQQTELFAEMFEALCGAIHLGSGSGFSGVQNWLIESCIKAEIIRRLSL